MALWNKVAKTFFCAKVLWLQKEPYTITQITVMTSLRYTVEFTQECLKQMAKDCALETSINDLFLLSFRYVIAIIFIRMCEARTFYKLVKYILIYTLYFLQNLWNAPTPKLFKIWRHSLTDDFSLFLNWFFSSQKYDLARSWELLKY